jgi:MFS family permease
MVLGVDNRILALATARMADALGNSFLIIVLPLYIASGQILLDGIVGGELLGFVLTEEFLIGLVLSLFGFLNSFGQPFTGRLSDRTRKRKLFILSGLVVFGVASAAYPFVSSYWAVLLVRATQGLGAAFTVPVTVALVNDYAESNSERGGNFGVFNTFRLVGFGFGPIVAGAVVTGGFGGDQVVSYGVPAWLPTVGGAQVSGFDAAFSIAVLGAIVSFALVSALVTDPEGGDMDADAGEDLSIAVRSRQGSGLDPVFVLGVATLFMALTIALFATLQETINTRLGQGSTLFGLQFSAVIVANVLFQVPVGRLSDEYGRRPFLLAGLVVLAPSVLLQGLVSDPLTMLGARFLQGVAVACVFAPALALAGDLAGEGQSGTQLSVLTMAFGLGVAFGPLASGFLVSYGFVVPFAFGAVLAVVALALVFTQVEESLTAGEDAPCGEPGPQD